MSAPRYCHGSSSIPVEFSATSLSDALHDAAAWLATYDAAPIAPIEWNISDNGRYYVVLHAEIATLPEELINKITLLAVEADIRRQTMLESVDIDLSSFLEDLKLTLSSN